MSEAAGTAREYFRHGRLRVTAEMIRARNRSIQLATVEGVEVTRPLFLMALAGCAGLAGLGLVFGDLLYGHEIAALLALGAGAMALSWRVGTLRVFSKLTRDRGWAVLWWIGPLHRMRDAIEAAMEDRARPARPPEAGRPPPRPSSPPDDDATIRLGPYPRR